MSDEIPAHCFKAPFVDIGFEVCCHMPVKLIAEAYGIYSQHLRQAFLEIFSLR